MNADRSLLDRLNPVTRIGLAVVVSVPLIITLDWLSAGVAMVLVVLVALVAGFRAGFLARRLAALAVVGMLGAASMALYGRPGGRVWFSWLLIEVTDTSVLLAVAVLLRVLALGLSALLLLGTVDPTDLADGLAQVLRLPARFVLGSLAGLRMLDLLTDDWRNLALARRARGLGDHGRVRRWLSMTFGLLVLAIRRGSRLATAMEARGFGTTGPDAPERTWARPSTVGAADLVGLMVGLMIVTVAVGAAMWFGTFFWVGS